MKLSKKIGLMTLLLIVVAGVSSCGGKKNNDKDVYEVTVDNSQIGGELSKYFTLEEKTYKYKKGIIDEVTVELKCIEPLPKDMEAYIGIDVLDEDGSVIVTNAPDVWTFNDYDLLRSATSGQIVTIKIENHEHFAEGETPAKIRLSSVVKQDESASGHIASVGDIEVSSSDEVSSDDSDGDDVYATSSSSGTEDWDALLNSYEQYVDKYISLAKKAAKGDMSALTEYGSLMEKAQEFSNKMQNAQGQMSASQWSRYMKITQKMAQAATN